MSMVARSVTLVRHGRTAYNAQHRIQGWVDIPLDAVGLWQAEQTGQALRDRYVTDADHVMVVSSPLVRAVETARCFADSLGVDVHTDDGFRERHFGDWEGARMEDVREQFPEDFDSWMHGLGGELHHRVEAHEHVGERAWYALRSWAQRADDDTDLFVFAHGALIEHVVQYMYGIGQYYPDYLSVSSMRNAHWARLRNAGIHDENRWILDEYNHGPALADTDVWEHPDVKE